MKNCYQNRSWGKEQRKLYVSFIICLFFRPISTLIIPTPLNFIQRMRRHICYFGCTLHEIDTFVRLKGKELLQKREKSVFGFTTSYAISAYHHQRCKFEWEVCIRYNIM